MITRADHKVHRIPEWFEHLYQSGAFKALDGTHGIDGRDGIDGVNGIDGVDGKHGMNGADGKDGAHGIDGKRGLKGQRGLRGFKGAMGAQGAKGDKGERGERGADGKDGKDGKQGAMPKHEIDGSRIRFEIAPNKWGKWIELMTISQGGGNMANIYDAKRYKAIRVLTADDTLQLNDNTVVCKTNAVTVTLYKAGDGYSEGFGNIHTIKNAKDNTNNITLTAVSGELIDGQAFYTVPPGAAPKIQTDGTEWHII